MFCSLQFPYTCILLSAALRGVKICAVKEIIQHAPNILFLSVIDPYHL